MTMWYYTTNGQQHGPVDEAGLNSLIIEGTVTTDTFVWRDGMSEWTPLAQARAAKSNIVRSEDTMSSTCTICGKQVGSENLIELMGKRVCADCKPMAVQSLREGASLPAKNHTAWREGKKVVAHSQTSLPARCFKCNHDVTTPPLTRKLYWHPVGYYVLLFFNIIIYAIVAMIVRKRATLDVYLCDQHLQRRKYFLIGGWSGAFLGLIMGFVAIAFNIGWLGLMGIILFLGAIIAGVAGGQVVRTTRIKGDTVWLAGSGKEFLASLPPFP